MRALVLRYGWNATAYQILNPGIHHWLAPDGSAAVGYVPAQRFPGGRRTTWMAAGGPVCARSDVDRSAAAFDAAAAAHGARVAWFGADRRILDAYAGRTDVHVVPIGAQPVWNPAALATWFSRKASLRAQLYRALNKGVEVNEWHAGAMDLSRLQPVLEAWLTRRGLPSLHFLVEPHTLDNLLDRRLFVATQAGEVVGFCLASPVPAREGWLAEQIIRTPGAPNGTAELLVEALARATAVDGSRYLTLGLVPLSPRGGSLSEPLWVRLLFRWIRAHTRRFYNFEGLERFKAKFEPEHWDPIALLAPGRHLTPGTLYAVADAFAGRRSPIRLVGLALADAIHEEARRARRHSRPTNGEATP